VRCPREQRHCGGGAWYSPTPSAADPGTLLFLAAQGAAAPFTLQPLSERFDPVDGALDAITHVELMTDVIISGLRSVVTAKDSAVAATARQPRVKRAVRESASRIRRG
jgi:hypothetical protein